MNEEENGNVLVCLSMRSDRTRLMSKRDHNFGLYVTVEEKFLCFVFK